MRRTLLLLILCMSLTSREGRAADLRDAVVKVYTTANPIDFYRPWQSKGSEPFTGSGCIIPGNRILTNAHAVTDQTFIQVKKFSDPKKYTAKLVAIGHDCDLAVLEVEDQEFFKGVAPLTFGELPNVQDTVNVVGYPTGGDEISVTEGVISRIEVTRYEHSYSSLLTVQIDAAINPGNSGGPVFKNGLLVGIAMQGLPFSQNIGYIIPMPIIRHFLDDLKDGKYDGFPLAGVEILPTENPTLREFYKIKDRKGGVLIAKVLPFSPVWEHLKEGDVVLEIDGIPVGEDGTFEFRNTERLLAVHLISQKQMGEQITLKIIRDGQERQVSFALTPFTPVVPNPYYAQVPSYYIFGGLVFTVLSADLLSEWRDRWGDERCRAPLDFTYYYFGSGRLNPEGKKEIIVLLTVLPDDINIGYHEYSTLVINKVNGSPFSSFKEFVKLLNERKDKYTVIDSVQKIQIILKNESIDEADRDILKRNNIPARYSLDVGEWLKEIK